MVKKRSYLIWGLSALLCPLNFQFFAQAAPELPPFDVLLQQRRQHALQTLSPEVQHAADPLNYSLSQLEHWSLVLYDIDTGHFQGQHPEHWDDGQIPASTYKIPHSLIGLESEIITPDSVFPWDGKTRVIQAWNQDHNLASALQVSCVPCYQQLARKIGRVRMRESLHKLHFGRMDVQDENLDHFWLRGNSRISPRQQVLFLAQLAQRQLPFARRHQDSVLRMMQDPQIPGLYAKTGWGIVPAQNGEKYHVGWYVGVFEGRDKRYSFAVQLIDEGAPPAEFLELRKAVLLRYLRELHLLS